MATHWDRQVWAERKSALDELADQLLWEIECCENNISRSEVLKSLICCLKEFLANQYSYFNDEIFSSSDLLFWEERVVNGLLDYPPDHVMEITLQQAAYDLDAIRRVIKDRSSCCPKNIEEVSLGDHVDCVDVDCIKGNVAHLKRMETLKIADCLAYYALLPARRICLIDPNIQVFTYFQKSTNIRLMPYAPVALIGIPETAVNVKRDLLAIPHEVGHYVFWHGTVPGNNGDACYYLPDGNSIRHTPFLFLDELYQDKWLEKQKIYENVRQNIANVLKNSIFCMELNTECFPVNSGPQSNTITIIESFKNSSLNAASLNKKWREEAIAYSWQEEIFCDVYGCLIAGVVIALDFQDLQLKWKLSDFFGEDGEHPAPTLRPYIYELVLKYLKDKFNDQAIVTGTENTPQVAARLNRLQQLSADVNQKWREKLAQRGATRNPTFTPIYEKQRYKKYISRMYTLSEDTVWEDLPLEARQIIEALSKETDPIDIDNLIDVNDLDNLDKPINKIIKGALAILGEMEPTKSAINVWGIIQNNVNQEGNIENAYRVYEENLDVRNNGESIVDPCSDLNMEDGKMECENYELLKENWCRDWPRPSTWPEDKKFWLPIFKAGGWAIKGPNSPWDKK